MVLAARNGSGGDESRNGRRSRGPSPTNGVVHTDSSDDDPAQAEKIRVGRDYQAVCPELTPESLRKPELIADRALLVWSPTTAISDDKLEEYIALAKDKYGYNGEQALGMLFWHKHDLQRAMLDLANFTPFPDDWSVEDKVLFEQAFQFHGKSFHRIRQMLPEKTIPALVKYYYSWKKIRTRTSQMDKQSKKSVVPREDGTPSDPGSEAGSNEDSDLDDKKWTIHRGIRRKSDTPPRSATSDENGNQGEGGACSNCGVNCTVMNVTPKGTLCTSCFLHWRRTGLLRPTSGPTAGKRGAPLGSRHKRKPPRGMYINHDDLAAMASGSTGVQMLKAMDRDVESLHRQIQQNKQVVSSLKRKHSDTIDDVRPTADNAGRVNSRWTQEELSLCLQGIKKYGRDALSIAQVLGNKTEHHVKSFFVTHRKKCKIDKLLEEYDRQHGTTVIEDEDDENNDTSSTKVIEIDDGADNSNDGVCLSSSTPKSDLRSNSKAA